MDFVVLGFGLGALIVLVGLGLRDLGPWLRRVPRPGRDMLQWSEVGRRVAWGRACRAGGLVLTLGGASVCLATLLLLIAGAGDDFGMSVVVACLLLALVALGGWAALFARRSGDGRQVHARAGGGRADVRQRPGAGGTERGRSGRSASGGARNGDPGQRSTKAARPEPGPRSPSGDEGKSKVAGSMPPATEAPPRGTAGS